MRIRYQRSILALFSSLWIEAGTSTAAIAAAAIRRPTTWPRPNSHRASAGPCSGADNAAGTRLHAAGSCHGDGPRPPPLARRASLRTSLRPGRRPARESRSAMAGLPPAGPKSGTRAGEAYSGVFGLIGNAVPCPGTIHFASRATRSRFLCSNSALSASGSSGGPVLSHQRWVKA
jgi:hypothetical protein